MSSEPPLWKFDCIAAQDPERGEKLQAAPSRTELSQRVVTALRVAMLTDSVRIGFDEFGEDERVVIQFHVGHQLFDWFFNGHTGYRAQFRNDWKVGHAYNRELVGMLRDELASGLEAEVVVRSLDVSFEDIGGKQVRRSRVLESLEPNLSKIWFSTELIDCDGQVRDLCVNLSGPRLVFDEYDSWAAPYADESYAWLDLKGAFVGGAGPFQIKDPIQRAKDLQRFGSA
jgi:hypothetical protein